jgi:hypothetical protein
MLEWLLFEADDGGLLRLLLWAARRAELCRQYESCLPRSNDSLWLLLLFLPDCFRNCTCFFDLASFGDLTCEFLRMEERFVLLLVKLF